eukprot:1084122-Pelagomonas_calceolata.AAC.1
MGWFGDVGTHRTNPPNLSGYHSDLLRGWQYIMSPGRRGWPGGVGTIGLRVMCCRAALSTSVKLPISSASTNLNLCSLLCHTLMISPEP